MRYSENDILLPVLHFVSQTIYLDNIHHDHKGWVISGFPYIAGCRISKCCYARQEVLSSLLFGAKKLVFNQGSALRNKLHHLVNLSLQELFYPRINRYYQFNDSEVMVDRYWGVPNTFQV